MPCHAMLGGGLTPCSRSPVRISAETLVLLPSEWGGGGELEGRPEALSRSASPAEGGVAAEASAANRREDPTDTLKRGVTKRLGLLDRTPEAVGEELGAPGGNLSATRSVWGRRVKTKGRIPRGAAKGGRAKGRSLVVASKEQGFSYSKGTTVGF